MEKASSNDGPLWVFGYGSLIWKADFPYKQTCVGYIKGHVRRFWQGSEDHRGVPGKPGRVVTLAPSDNPEETVWGMAYEIAPMDVNKVVAYLDCREKCGYKAVDATFYPHTSELTSFQLKIYIGTKDNPYFLGPAPIEQLAKQIYTAVGPSGSNSEYLFQLADGMRQYMPHVQDTHLFELERQVKALQSENHTDNKLEQLRQR